MGFTVEADDGELLELVLDHLLQPHWQRLTFRPGLACYRIRRPPPEHSMFTVTVDGDALISDSDPGRLADALEELIHLRMAENSSNYAFIHAGAVAIGGQGILLPASSMAGKSTLVQAMLAAGADYFSDEYAVLDRQGRLHAFPRRLSLREPQPRRISLEVLGCRPMLPVAVRLVAELSYEQGQGLKLVPISAGQGALRLLSHAVAARRRPQELLALFSSVCQSALCLQGHRQEAEEAALQLFLLVGNLGKGS